MIIIYLIIDINVANKNEAINILGLIQYGLACKYGIIFQITMYNWM